MNLTVNPHGTGIVVVNATTQFGEGNDLLQITPTGGNGIFSIPLPEYTFQLYRNDIILDNALVATSYYDSTVVSGTEYCYTVTQTEGAATPSGLSDPSCDDVYIPSTCQTAHLVELDSIHHIDGIPGRDEWFYYQPTM